jgi:hypothetical protein
MNNRIISRSLGICTLLTATALAGPDVFVPVGTPDAAADGFANARRPMTNPTLFDLALPTTNVHAIAMFHSLPNQVNTTLGSLDMGGEVNVYALQLEYALNERWSLVATKDGYVDFKPDNTALWTKQSGFANLAGGVKYAFVLDPQAGRALSGTVSYEAPTGNRDVFQGSGDGSVNLILSGLQMAGAWQFAAGAGLALPISDQQSTSNWLSVHASYEVTPWFIPLVELNWFHVLDTGDGKTNFTNQATGLVPEVAKFEGGDLLNFGALNSSANRDFVSAAVGFRSRICKGADFGIAYEVPLTNEEDGIMENRLTLDLVWRF